MVIKIVVALVAVTLMLGYLLPPVFKLKQIDLGIAIVVGLIMMAIDLWQSLRSKDD